MRGENCFRVSTGAVPAAIDAHQFTIDPTSPAEYARVLGDLSRRLNRPLRGIVHLGSLDQADVSEPTIALNSALDTGCRSVLSLAQALGTSPAGQASRLWLVTRNAQPAGDSTSPSALGQAPLWGLGKVIALEHPELSCTRVDLDPAMPASEVATLCEQLLAPDDEPEIAFRGESRRVARLARYRRRARSRTPDSDAAEGAMRVENTTPGILDGLTMRPAQRRAPGPGEVEIRVRAVGLNFRDVLSAMGMYPGDAGALGVECAGTVVAVGAGVSSFSVGQDVAGIAFGCFGTHATTSALLLIPRIAKLSHEQMATIPNVYLTALYCLREVAGIGRGERVLIHAASGGVGLAAVQLAKAAGLEIFATAGSDSKRAFLKSLGVPHVMDSRSLAFAEEIRRTNAGRRR